MEVPILVCGCGMRIRAPGARPGRVGRCPSCGGRLEVPEAPAPLEDMEPVSEIALADSRRTFTEPTPTALSPARTGSKKRKRGSSRGTRSPSGTVQPMADGVLPLLSQPEKGWLVSVLYPLRGAESLAMLASLSLLFWIFGVLVVEYCLQAMNDTASQGAGLLGILFVIIALVPVVVLSPMILSYWLQYLGRILVTSAQGDCAPPRMPDRNFDGLFNGMSPWFIWLVLGLGLGLLPAIGLARPAEAEPVGNSAWLAAALAIVALPYILAALMLCFIHDDTFAAMPWGVLLALVRLGPGFLVLSGLILCGLGLVGGSFALALWIRSRAFWPYLLVALFCIMGLQWMQMVIMRLLGIYYFHHKAGLRWQNADLRWGVNWRL